MAWLDDVRAGAGPVLLCLGLFWLGLILRGREDALVRAASAASCALLTLRYAVWRITDGLPEFSQGLAGDVWTLIFLVFEMLSLLSLGLSLLVLSRNLSRSAEADRHARHPICLAPVDIFIATYNEGPDILERTLIAACAVDHADKRVWLLDDGARNWVRALAEAHGAQYVCRVKGKHAKAGNVNNGLAHALATGRKPDFILLLDADFVASRAILRRTLPLFHAADVGIVQTPQHFFNPDPVQINVFSPTVWPDEQRFFFDVLMPSLDAWGGAFCCGTSAVLRVKALLAVGGLATETVTEDMLTSFKLVEQGWRTVYLDEPLSLGLAPEGVSEYIIQRSRWCLGAVQQIYTRWSFLGPARLGWIQRLNNFSSLLFWGATFPYRVMVMAAPAIWWWTGVTSIHATVTDLAQVLLPFYALNACFNAVYSANRQLPLLSDINLLVPSAAIIGSVFTGLVRPWGQPFRVTPKGLSSERVTIHGRLMAPFVLLAALTLAGMAANLDPDADRRGDPGYMLAVVWSMIGIAMLAVTAMACVDQPRRRRDERFLSGERAIVLVPGMPNRNCIVQDISLGGARLHSQAGWGSAPKDGQLWLDDGELILRFTTVRAGGSDLAIRFELSRSERAAMILKLFDVRYKSMVSSANPIDAIGVAFRRLLA